MALKSLTVKNFKTLRSLELPSLGQVNLFVGKNNSGKTTILEALRVLASNASLSTFLEIAVEREDAGPDSLAEVGQGVKALAAGIFSDQLLEGRSIFIGDPFSRFAMSLQHLRYLVGDPQMREGATIPGRRQVLTVDEVERFLRDGGDAEEIREALGIALAQESPDLMRIDRELPSMVMDSSLWRREALMPYAYVPARLFDVDELAARWDQVAITDHESYVVRALKIVEPAIKALTFVESGSVLEDARRRLERKAGPRGRILPRRVPIVRLEDSDKRVPLRAMGDGLHRALDIVVRLAAVSDGVLLIDEFENGLHHSMQADLWRIVFALAKLRSVQVFATTHSLDCVRAFSQVASEDEQVGVMYRIVRHAVGDADATHFIRRYSEESLIDAIDAEVEVR